MSTVMHQIQNLKINMEEILQNYPVSVIRSGDYYIYTLAKNDAWGKHFVQVQEGIPFAYREYSKDERFVESLLESGCRISIVDCPKGSCQKLSAGGEWMRVLYEEIIQKYPEDEIFLSGNYSSGMSTAIIQIMRDIQAKQKAS